MSSVTLPAWGSLRNGELSERPTPGHLTSGLDYSSLPTPNARDAVPRGSMPPNIRKAQGHQVTLNDVVEKGLALLPTPKATNNENRQSLDRYGMNLGMALESIGETTDPQFADGPMSSDDPHQPQLSLDELALPA